MNTGEHNQAWRKVMRAALVNGMNNLLMCSDGTAWILTSIYLLLIKGLDAEIEAYDRHGNDLYYSELLKSIETFR